MSHTPTQTPNRTGRTNKKLPMIVDIALDDDGQQLYQVHESSRHVRKEMPISTNFSCNETEKTPIRKILGIVSPSTLNQKKVKDEDEDEENELGSFAQPESATKRTGDLNIFTGNVEDNYEFQNETDRASSTDIWSDDVEMAFEEILAIIPKKSSNKIKISGRSCGRNELISDYILNKTGKFRSRKQVSSHIQVIKNLAQKPDIIKLINEGPSFETEQEKERNEKRFEEIFSKINLDKSLGMTDVKKRKESTSSSSKPAKKLRTNQIIKVENFYMLINDVVGGNPIILTFQNSNELKSLKIRENAKISNRFPGLNEFQNTDIPILHNMVKIHLPHLPKNYTIDGLQTNYFLLDSYQSDYSIFTCIYSFGNEVLKFNDINVKANENQPFLPKFWKFFISKLINNPNPMEVNMAFKGITIKQIIYESSGDSNLVLKLKIKSVSLWEFAKVDQFKDATTSVTKLILPTQTIADIQPLVVDYHPASLDSATTTSTATMPPTVSSILDDHDFETKPQLSVQQKFETLQHHQDQQQSQPFQNMLHPSVNTNLMTVSKDSQSNQFGGALFSENEFMNINLDESQFN